MVTSLFITQCDYCCMQNNDYGLTWTAYGFADHHTENLEIFEVNTWVNLELYGTLVRVVKNGWTHCIIIFARCLDLTCTRYCCA